MRRDRPIYLRGKTKWFRAQQPNKYGKWSHDIYLTEESLETFRELQMSENGIEGIKNDIKKDEDGFYVTLSRPTRRTYAGKDTPFNPPQVLDSKGAPYLGTVGNGSDVTTKVEVYTYNVPMTKGVKGTAIRWDSSRIDNLVEFVPDRDYFAVEEKQVAALRKQPEPVEGGW